MMLQVAGAVGLAPGVVALEIVLDLWMAHRFARFVHQQVLLGYIGYVFGLVVLGEKMIKRLIFPGADFLRYRVPPLFRVVEHGIDIEDNATEGKKPVAYNLSNTKLSG